MKESHVWYSKRIYLLLNETDRDFLEERIRRLNQYNIGVSTIEIGPKRRDGMSDIGIMILLIRRIIITYQNSARNISTKSR